MSSFGSRQTRYQGLQIFTYQQDIPTPREIFNESLLLKSEGGADLIAQWSAEREDGRPLIVLKGSGVLKVFSWDEGTRRFKHSLPLTQRRLLKGHSTAGGNSSP
ncbi:MAG: hypothetical protein VYD19_07350 [Myxococcota bacterium]|nr:hypothetical protein [Myxococcota bacterium]